MTDGKETALTHGKAYDANGTQYIYLRADAVSALGVEGGDEVAVFDDGDGGLRVLPKDGDAPGVVECVYCETPIPRGDIADHHASEHQWERYDPVWYLDDEGGDDS
jgi:hypothetical protein